jgi:hypothetical protein
MTEEVESFGGSRWEVQDIKVLAGWPAKPQTPWQPLVAWLYNATPHAYAKMPLAASSVFLSDMHPWTSVRGVRWVNCTSWKELGIYGRYRCLAAPQTHSTANRRLSDAHLSYLLQANRVAKGCSFTVFRTSPIWSRNHAFK